MRCQNVLRGILRDNEGPSKIRGSLVTMSQIVCTTIVVTSHIVCTAIVVTSQIGCIIKERLIKESLILSPNLQQSNNKILYIEI